MKILLEYLEHLSQAIVLKVKNVHGAELRSSYVKEDINFNGYEDNDSHVIYPV